jgi:hypothetical protein
VFNPFSALTSKIFGGVAIFAITFGAIQTVRLDGFFWIDGVIEKLDKERAAHIATKVGYANAAKVAADLNKKQVDSIKSQYAAIAERTEDEYEKRLADNRRSLTLWMQARTIERASKGSGTGIPTSMPAEAVPATAQTEFLVGAEDLEIASDNYSQLVALIEWAKSIGEVKPEQ